MNTLRYVGVVPPSSRRPVPGTSDRRSIPVSLQEIIRMPDKKVAEKPSMTLAGRASVGPFRASHPVKRSVIPSRATSAARRIRVEGSLGHHATRLCIRNPNEPSAARREDACVVSATCARDERPQVDPGLTTGNRPDSVVPGKWLRSVSSRGHLPPDRNYHGDTDVR